MEDKLNSNIQVIRVALEMLDDEDLSDLDHLRNYQRRVKRFFNLERFAFVDENGLVYTADEGVRDEMGQYPFDYQTLSEPGVFIKDQSVPDKRVIIAYPIRDRKLSVESQPLAICFMEIDMNTLLQDVSMKSQSSGTTFSNIYTSDGIALTNTVLGGLAVEDNLLEALEHAQIVLRQAGICCELAASGAEALEKVRLRHARRDDYDLLLVDWKMPEMDGVETTRQIRVVVGSDTPIVILTSYNWDEVAEEAMRAGVDTFVAKPLFAGHVLDQFRVAFRRKSAEMKVEKADLKGRRVLLAEDVEVNADIMVMVLSMREINTDVAQNGRIAVDKYLSQPAGTYDAILMDMRMPEMDGLEATRQIRASGREDAQTIPIIALTANAFDEDVQRSMQAGLNAHLSKPVEPNALFDTLEKMIRP